MIEFWGKVVRLIKFYSSEIAGVFVSAVLLLFLVLLWVEIGFYFLVRQ